MNITSISQIAIRKSARKALVLCLLAAITSAFLLYETAQAQEVGYVDLVMLYEQQGPRAKSGKSHIGCEIMGPQRPQE